MFWQKVKSAMRWLGKKIIAGLSWFYVKLRRIIQILFSSAPTAPISTLHQEEKPLSIGNNIAAESKTQLVARVSSTSSLKNVFHRYIELPLDLQDIFLKFLTHRELAHIFVAYPAYGKYQYRQWQNRNSLPMAPASATSIAAVVPSTIGQEEQRFFSNNYHKIYLAGKLLNDMVDSKQTDVAQTINHNSSLMLTLVNFIHQNGYSERICPMEYALRNEDNRQVWEMCYEKIKINHAAQQSAFLMYAVLYANYDAAERVINDNPASMFESRDFVYPDGSKECISPLKYAFKVYDTYMWEMFYERIEKETNPTLRQQYIKQYMKQMLEQTTHIDLSLLFEAYIKCETKDRHYWRHKDIAYEEVKKECFNVGMIQRRILPVHMLKEFSREGDIWRADSSFDINVTPRPKNCGFYEEYTTGDWKSLSSTLSDPKWGISFLLVKGRPDYVTQAFRVQKALAFQLSADRATFRRLFEVRKEDLAKKRSLMLQNFHEAQAQENQNSAVSLNLLAP